MALTTETKTQLTHPADGDDDWNTNGYVPGFQAFESRWRYKSDEAPSAPFPGMLWIDDTTATSWSYKNYDGTDWITVGTLDVTGNSWTPGSAGSAFSLDEATTAQILANTADKVLTTDQTWGALTAVALTSGTSVAVDLSLGINFSLTLGHNATLANPTSTKAGQSGLIVITQDGTGGRTLAFDTNYKSPNGIDPVLSTGAGDIDVLAYYVVSASVILIAPWGYDWA